MSRHTQGSLAIIGAIAAGIFLVALVALMVLGDFAISPAVFIALLIAGLAAFALYLGFGGSAQIPTMSARSTKPAEAPKPAAASVSPATPEPEQEPVPAAASTPAAAVDHAGVGHAESSVDGSRPTSLDAPRGGKADDLKQIKGVGPKMEKLCNSMGFFHFDQIANWTADEVAWVDANLEGFKGRVSRDSWVEQARVLADGGETDFSKRVEDGEVY